MTSGAIQCGVPMYVLRLDMVCVSCAATPKSASFTCQTGRDRHGRRPVAHCDESLCTLTCSLPCSCSGGLSGASGRGSVHVHSLLSAASRSC